MQCYQCQNEAVERCYTCGALFCAEHGNVNCERCDTAIAPGDCRPDHISATPLATERKQGWWRPQQAEEFTIPACYHCKGLARQRCHHCQSYYCPEHAGSGGLCASCHRSSNLGLAMLLGSLLLIGLLLLFGYWRG